ncbi:MAG: hypothetical protein WCZ66_09250 [Sphingomonadaceae bacterium]
MAKLACKRANATQAIYDSSYCHGIVVRDERTIVNVDNVRGRVQKTYMLTTGQRLQILRGRSGLSVRGLAEGAGYKTGSGVQEYLQPHYDKLLPLPLVRRLAEALVGLGDPPIDSADVYRLAGVFPSEAALREMFHSLLTPEAIAEGRSGLAEILAKRLPEAFALALDESPCEKTDGANSHELPSQLPTNKRRRKPPAPRI